MSEHFSLLDRYLETGDLKRAEILIARLLRAENELPGERANILLRRARVRLLAEKPDDALEDLQMSYSLQPELAGSAEALELSGDIYFARFELASVGFAERADADRALECYEALIAREPDYPNLGWVLYQKGRILLSDNRVQEAAAVFRQALEQSSRVSSLAALCYERLGFVELAEARNPAAALDFFAQAVESYPAGGDASWLVQLHILRSRALREQGRYADALKAARQALTTIDTSAADYRRALPEAHLAVGEVLAHIAGREEEAIDHLVQFLQYSKRPLGIDVTWSRVHQTIGDLAFRLGRYELAVEAYMDGLAFNPYHPLAVTLYYQVAICYYRMRAYHRTVEMIDRMQQLAAVDGDSVQDYRVFNLLGDAWFALRVYDRAAEAYEQASRLVPEGTEPFDTLRSYWQTAHRLFESSKQGR